MSLEEHLMVKGYAHYLFKRDKYDKGKEPSSFLVSGNLHILKKLLRTSKWVVFIYIKCIIN